jgi:hypothetical protein
VLAGVFGTAATGYILQKGRDVEKHGISRNVKQDRPYFNNEFHVHSCGICINVCLC